MKYALEVSSVIYQNRSFSCILMVSNSEKLLYDVSKEAKSYYEDYTEGKEDSIDAKIIQLEGNGNKCVNIPGGDFSMITVNEYGIGKSDEYLEKHLDFVKSKGGQGRFAYIREVVDLDSLDGVSLIRIFDRFFGDW